MMMATDLHVEIDRKVFNPVYIPQFQNMSRLQILFGGAASGKSKFKAQQAIYDVMRGGRNYLVCRQVGRTIRGSVAQEINRVIVEWGVDRLFSINKTDGTITCINGFQVIFTGLDDVEKLKSIIPARGAITDIWVEEATEISQDSLKHLLKRQRGGSDKTAKRIHLTFNPILRQHWIFKTYFSNLGWADDQREYNSPELSILKTTYKDNRFLTGDDVRDLENEKDPYYYNVYTLGNWGVLGNVIFTNWKVEDLSGMREQFVNLRNGLDFGFADNPAALSRSHYDKNHKTIYIFDELYETGLQNDILADRIKEIIPIYRVDKDGKYVLDKDGKKIIDNTERIICDSAEPKSIAELRKYGVDAYSAHKGKDSIVHGIQWLQQQTIIIDSKCINAQNEFSTYKWKEDAGGAVVRSGGLPVPLDRNNHFIDATRYGYEEDSLDIGEMEEVENPFYS
jgi:phage terminase large subunit